MKRCKHCNAHIVQLSSGRWLHANPYDVKKAHFPEPDDRPASWDKKES